MGSDRHGEEVHVVALDVSDLPHQVSKLAEAGQVLVDGDCLSGPVEEAVEPERVGQSATGKGLVHHRNQERLLAPDPADVAAVIDVHGHVAQCDVTLRLGSARRDRDVEPRVVHARRHRDRDSIERICSGRETVEAGDDEVVDPDVRHRLDRAHDASLPAVEVGSLELCRFRGGHHANTRRRRTLRPADQEVGRDADAVQARTVGRDMEQDRGAVEVAARGVCVRGAAGTFLTPDEQHVEGLPIPGHQDPGGPVVAEVGVQRLQVVVQMAVDEKAGHHTDHQQNGQDPRGPAQEPQDQHATPMAFVRVEPVQVRPHDPPMAFVRVADAFVCARRPTRRREPNISLECWGGKCSKWVTLNRYRT